MKEPIGTRVEVWSQDETEYFGLGIIIGYERVTVLGETIEIDKDRPIIRLSDGDEIKGDLRVFKVKK